jgi:RND family efflux transporter MFP subunit
MPINKKIIKKTIYWIIFIAIVITTGFIIWGNKNKKVDYTLAPVSRGTLSRTISADGKYLSKDEADVSFQITGPVMNIKVDVGDKVEKGQLLASIDPGVLIEELQQAKKEVSAQKETYAFMKKHGTAYKYNNLQAQKDTIEKSQAAVDEVSRQLQYADITAPIDGTVAEKNVSVGEIAQAGSPAVTIIRGNDMRIEANVPEVDIAGVAVGQKVSVKFDAYPENQRFDAVITDIDPAPITVQNVGYYVVKMDVENPDPGFKYGMNCTIYDQTNQKDNVLIIPEGLIETSDDKKFADVLVDEQKKTVEKREIQTGLEGDDGMIEVVSGLREGDQIAVEK